MSFEGIRFARSQQGLPQFAAEIGPADRMVLSFSAVRDSVELT